MLTLRHLVEEADGLYRVVAGATPILRYYAKSLAHFFEKAPIREAARQTQLT